MPDIRCDTAIIGGGIIGAAIAYHLAGKGRSDVVVVEKEDMPGLGSTAKAAGGIRAQFGSAVNIELSKISLDCFERFPKEMNVEVVFHQVGYCFFTSRDGEMEIFRKNVALQRKHGLDVRLVTPDEIAKIAPYLRTDDLVGGTFHQRDGYAPPADHMTGYETNAKKLGAKVLTSAEVTAIAPNLVTTKQGQVRAERIICAAGCYSRSIGAMAGIDIPIDPVRRQVFVTQQMPKFPHPTPMTIDYASGVYMHSDGRAMLVGKANKQEPPGFNETVDHEFMAKTAELAMERVPDLADAEIATSWAGLYEVTPDHHPIIGPVADKPWFWIAAGFSGHGVMHSPATGILVAEWIADGRPSLDLGCLRYERFRENDLIRETHVI
ncbi:MAG: NAD(P)/FAD-dependent oxidoreductase [Planctomycetota bacterium]|jgi:sarcosine oxidase subunit beta